MDAVRILMHIDRAHQIAMASKAALAADPVSPPGLVCVLASGTPAAGASFGAGRAQDASLLAFVREVVNVLAVFPLRHAPVVMAALVLSPDAVRVAHEERPDAVLDAEVNHFAGALVPQVAHAPLGTSADLVLGALQLLPTAGMLLAAALLFGELAELLAPLPLEGADAAPGHDQRLARVGGHGGEVDFPQVHRRLHRAGSLFRRHNVHADVQLEAPVPDERTRPGILGERERQHQGWVTLAHRQDDAPLLNAYRLRGPLDWVEPFLAPGIFHVHLGVLPAQFAGGFNRAEEGAQDGLHRLAVQGEAPLGQLVQIILAGPAGMAHSRLLVDVHAPVPDLGCLHLRRFESAEEHGREASQAIHANCLHMFLFFFFARRPVIYRVGSSPSGIAFIPPPRREWVFPLHLITRDENAPEYS